MAWLLSSFGVGIVKLLPPTASRRLGYNAGRSGTNRRKPRPVGSSHRRPLRNVLTDGVWEAPDEGA
jgi:hypothetical protein